MNITPEEHQHFRQCINNVKQEAGMFVLPVNGNLVWHYTDGNGLLGIVQSSKLRSTQVAALNDSRETEYAQRLFAETFRCHVDECKGSARDYHDAVARFWESSPLAPNRATSNYFVTCFTEKRDDISQWQQYGKGKGYAIGFCAACLKLGPDERLYRVIYDPSKLKQGVDTLVEQTRTLHSKEPLHWACFPGHVGFEGEDGLSFCG